MSQSELREFGRILVESVRDAAVEACELALRADTKYPKARRWKKAMATSSPEELVRTVALDVVDTTISTLLTAIDRSVLGVKYQAKNGQLIDLACDGMGELCGWYLIIPDGWRARYTKQPYFDDFTDLKLDP